MDKLSKKIFIEPVHEQTKVLGEIAHCLFYNAGHIAAPGAGQTALLVGIADDIRCCASRLSATTGAIRLYGLWSKLRLIPKKDNVVTSIRLLTGISNGMFKGDTGENARDAAEIKKLLELNLLG